MQSSNNTPATPFTTQSSDIVYSNAWINVHEDAIVFDSGRKDVYGYIESKDSVMVIATNHNDEIFLVKAYRHPTKQWGWELPGGSGDGEDPVTAGKRELQEETGFTSNDWQSVGKPLVCNGLMTERTHFLVARNVTEGVATEDEEAFLDKKFFSKENIEHMIQSGDIDDGQTITGLYLYKISQEGI